MRYRTNYIECPLPSDKELWRLRKLIYCVGENVVSYILAD
jgi:hypothetical protein